MGAEGGLPPCGGARPRPDGLEIAVNVSAVQLRDNGLVDDVLRALDSSGLDPSRLILELTESAVVNDIEAAAITLCELRTHGVRIALDDFGAGYASLRHLRAFPVDIVKLDRSFVVNSLENDSTVLSGLISMASSLGMETVGEGIEEPGQLDMLRIAELPVRAGLPDLPGRCRRIVSTTSMRSVSAADRAMPMTRVEERTPVRYTEEGVVTR